MIYSPAMGKKVSFVVDVTELGRKGGAATAASRTPKQRKAASQKAIAARWAKYYAENPDKLAAKLARDAQKGKRAKKARKTR